MDYNTVPSDEIINRTAESLKANGIETFVVANAEEANVRNADALIVSKAGVDSGPTLKRIQPHARGMGFMIKKRMSHITVSVSLPEQK